MWLVSFLDHGDASPRQHALQQAGPAFHCAPGGSLCKPTGGPTCISATVRIGCKALHRAVVHLGGEMDDALVTSNIKQQASRGLPVQRCMVRRSPCKLPS